MSQLDGVIEQVKPQQTTVTLVLRADLIDGIERLERDLIIAQEEDAKSNKPKRAPGIAAEIQQLRAEARESSKDLTLTSIGSLGWSELQANHPPSKAQREKNPRLEWNPDTFPYEAIAACLGTDWRDEGALKAGAEQVRELRKVISDGQWQNLWLSCQGVNVVSVDVPFSARAFGVLHGSGQSLTSAESGASPEATS